MGRGGGSTGGDRMTRPHHGGLQPHKSPGQLNHQPHRPGNVGLGAEGH